MDTIQDKEKRSRAEINRENAQKSTGPKTPEGKKRSSLNATRHGVTGQITCLPTEDLAAFAQFTKALIESLNPVGSIETDLAQSYAESRWQAHHSRSWQRLALSEKASETIPLYPDTNRPEVNSALAVASAALYHSRELANLVLYEQRYNRAAAQCLKDLEILQAARHKTEKIALEEAAFLLELHEKEEAERVETIENDDPTAGRPTPRPYDPAGSEGSPTGLLVRSDAEGSAWLRANGFVFSTPVLKLYIDRRERLRAARELPEKQRMAA